MYYFFRKLVEIYIKAKYRIVIHNLKNYNDIPAEGGYIIACNHQSYADPPIVSGLIRAKYSFMAKSELFKNPVFGWIIKRCGAFPVVRGSGDNSAIDRSVSDLKKGRVLLIFPEGTRSKDGTIARGKSGIAVIAGTLAAPVLPVCIVYGQMGDKKRVDFAVGKMIPPEETAIAGTGRREIRQVAERITNEIRQLQQEIFANTDNSGNQGKDKDN